MRKWNNVLARVIIVLFLLHALMGSLMLLGISRISLKPLSWFLLSAVLLHGILGIISTIPAFKTVKKTGQWFFKENAAFWTKRISGIAIMLLLSLHITSYTTSVNGKFFLQEFTTGKMAAQILLILSIFIHLMVGIRSMLIAKGTIKFKERTVDWMLVLSIMMIFFTIAVVAYYIQWQM